MRLEHHLQPSYATKITHLGDVLPARAHYRTTVCTNVPLGAWEKRRSHL